MLSQTCRYLPNTSTLARFLWVVGFLTRNDFIVQVNSMVCTCHCALFWLPSVIPVFQAADVCMPARNWSDTHCDIRCRLTTTSTRTTPSCRARACGFR